MKWCVAFAPDVVSRSAKTLGMLVKSAHRNWKKVKEHYKSHQSRQYHQFGVEKFDAFLKLCKNEGNEDVINMLQLLIHKIMCSPWLF